MRYIPHKKEREKGAALITATLFMLLITLMIVLGIAGTVGRDVSAVYLGNHKRHAFLFGEGALEDVVYRIRLGESVDPTETYTYGDNTAEVNTVIVGAGEQEVSVRGEHGRSVQRSKVILVTGDGVSFSFGLQSGNGGVIFENSSFVTGNVYSNGTITGSGNYIYGDVVSAGIAGTIDDVHATGSAYAHNIIDSIIDKDAYYQSISGTVVGGTSYSGSNDQPTAAYPIADSKLDEWEVLAEAGGTYGGSCPYKITGAVTIGPLKIPCDLEISGNNYTVTLAGHVWVEGDVEVQNSPTVQVDPSLGSKSIAVIAHKPSQLESSGTIELQNGATFAGSGASNSYVLFVSRNTSASVGGGTKAVKVQNSASGDLLVFAPYGEVEIGNNISLKEVTAYRIRLKNSAEVVYETELASLLFDSGPGGGYVLSEWGRE